MRIRRALVPALAAAAAMAVLAAGCKVPDASSGPAVQNSGSDTVEYAATCDVDGGLVSYSPHTPEAHAAAAAECARLDVNIDSAPWPGGLHEMGEDQ